MKFQKLVLHSKDTLKPFTHFLNYYKITSAFFNAIGNSSFSFCMDTIVDEFIISFRLFNLYSLSIVCQYKIVTYYFGHSQLPKQDEHSVFF